MVFYSGFSLQNDKVFFDSYLDNSVYSVAGFSYGAQKAFLHVKQMIQKKQRVDRLQLISPAFFQAKAERFKKLQLKGYEKDSKLYLKNFIQSCFFPYEVQEIEHNTHSIKDLEDLLFFKWNIDELVFIKESGVLIEVYLGGKDSVSDVTNAYEFFKEVADITYIKDANHFLQIKKGRQKNVPALFFEEGIMRNTNIRGRSLHQQLF